PVVTGGVAIQPLPARRLAEPFERLREAADAHAARTGQAPRVFLAGLGPGVLQAARGDWVRDFLAAGGMGVLAGDEVVSASAAGRAFTASGAAGAVICTAAGASADDVEATAAALKAAGARRVLAAGAPKAQEAALKVAGVDELMTAGIDAPGLLGRLQGALGVAG